MIRIQKVMERPAKKVLFLFIDFSRAYIHTPLHTGDNHMNVYTRH